MLQPIVLTNSFATCDVYLHIRTSDADPDELQYYTDPRKQVIISIFPQNSSFKFVVRK